MENGSTTHQTIYQHTCTCSNIGRVAMGTILRALYLPQIHIKKASKSTSNSPSTDQTQHPPSSSAINPLFTPCIPYHKLNPACNKENPQVRTRYNHASPGYAYSTHTYRHRYIYRYRQLYSNNQCIHSNQLAYLTTVVHSLQSTPPFASTPLYSTHPPPHRNSPARLHACAANRGKPYLPRGQRSKLGTVK